MSGLGQRITDVGAELGLLLATPVQRSTLEKARGQRSVRLIEDLRFPQAAVDFHRFASSCPGLRTEDGTPRYRRR
jgi:hypothetical protein